MQLISEADNKLRYKCDDGVERDALTTTIDGQKVSYLVINGQRVFLQYHKDVEAKLTANVAPTVSDMTANAVIAEEKPVEPIDEKPPEEVKPTLTVCPKCGFEYEVK
jgi:hypothetical protein